MELRPYQQQAKDAIFSEWENGIKKTLLVLPTGCGKTIVFAKEVREARGPWTVHQDPEYSPEIRMPCLI